MAAASVAIVSGRNARTALKTYTIGASNMALVKHTPSTSYATGGDAVDFSTIGAIGTGIATTTKQPTAVFIQPAGGYMATYDLTNKKMLVYQQSAATSALTEVASTTDLHATVFTCLVFW